MCIRDRIEGEEDSGVVADVNAEIQKIVDDYKAQAEQQIAEYKEAFIATGGTEEELSLIHISSIAICDG